jgi:hypothetical protein
MTVIGQIQGELLKVGNRRHGKFLTWYGLRDNECFFFPVAASGGIIKDLRVWCPQCVYKFLDGISFK